MRKTIWWLIKSQSHPERITLEMEAAHAACPAAVRQLMLERPLRRLLFRWLARSLAEGRSHLRCAPHVAASKISVANIIRFSSNSIHSAKKCIVSMQKKKYVWCTWKSATTRSNESFSLTNSVQAEKSQFLFAFAISTIATALPGGLSYQQCAGKEAEKLKSIVSYKSGAT